MTSSKKITLGLIFLLVGKVHMAQFSDREQHGGLVTAEVGETVTLPCYYESDVYMYFSWYKQTLGGKLQLASLRIEYERNATFYKEFKNNRFSVQSGNGINHLKISDLQLSDSGTYYCGTSFSGLVEFPVGVMLHVKGSWSNIQAVTEKPVSESVQPGDSVTLNCTVLHTETCDGEHSVYWFRRSGESQVELIYTHDAQCKESYETGTTTQSCFYSLSMKNLAFSDAGTYYCAVASCGEILFGNGTTLEIEEGDCAAQMRIMAFLSISRTGVLLCSLLILSILYMTRK